MVSCTCSLWLEISSRALNLWSCKYSKKQETGTPKNEKGKPFFLLLGPVNSTPARGNTTRDAGVSAAHLRLRYGNSSNTVISHRLHLASVCSWSWASGEIRSQPSCLSVSAGLAQHHDSHQPCIPGDVSCVPAAPAQTLRAAHQPLGSKLHSTK